LSHSSRTRSGDTLRKTSSAPGIAASVRASSSISSVAAKRAARSTRRPSSPKRRAGSPTARMLAPRGRAARRTVDVTRDRVVRDRVHREVAPLEIALEIDAELTESGR
jgi:hypothetical protein